MRVKTRFNPIVRIKAVVGCLIIVDVTSLCNITAIMGPNV